MPLTINVGLSRKTSQNYNSEGVSINLTAELDQSLLARPDQLQQQVGQLYRQAEAALDQQANGHASAPPPSRQNGGNRPNGRTNGGGMTQSQRRAIEAITRRLGIDAHAECRTQLGLELDDLTVRQASQLIDHLKGLTQTAAGNGGRR